MENALRELEVNPVHSFRADKQRYKVGKDMKMYLDCFDDITDAQNELDQIEEETKEA